MTGRRTLAIAAAAVTAVLWAYACGDGGTEPITPPPDPPRPATVDGSGLVTGMAEGVATITASSGGAEGAAEITVENPDRAALWRSTTRPMARIGSTATTG